MATSQKTLREQNRRIGINIGNLPALFLLELLKTAPSPELSGESFDKLRKCLQLLNRLEDWVLADDFAGRTEIVEKEFQSLMKKCQSTALASLEEIGPDISGDFTALHEGFPQQDNLQKRARYYVRIMRTRTHILRLLESVQQ